MEFESLLKLVGDEPVFETALLLAGGVSPDNVRLQLSRWTKSGRLYQLRRGLYALAPPYQKVRPHPFLAANRLVRASYVSAQSALAFYGLIPEVATRTLSVTTGRPSHWETPLGVFDFHHVKAELFSGYRQLHLESGQQGFVATPEKALLDLVYLQPGGDSPAFLHELRLQNLDRLDLKTLLQQAERFHGRKILRAVQTISALARDETEQFETV